MKPWLHRIETPLGPIQAAANAEGGLVYLGFVGHEDRKALMGSLEQVSHELLRDSRGMEPLRRQLDAYFQGRRKTFDLPLDLRGTPFRLRVWEALRHIPYGTTVSYGELAKQLGDPKLSRAVGTANGANPLSIVIPCHRVIGSDGGLTGYAGGLGIKEALLKIEGVLAH